MEPETARVGLSVLTCDAANVETRSVAGVEDALGLVGPERSTWLRIVGHAPQTLTEVGSRLRVHPLVIEDIAAVGQRPKVEVHAGYVFVVLQALRKESAGAVEQEQVSLLLFENLLVTIEERDNQLFAPIEERLRAGHEKLRTAGVDFLAHTVIDTIVDYLYPLLDDLGGRIGDIEEELLERPDRASLQSLHLVKRELLRVRRVVWPTRELLAALARGDSPLIDAECTLYLRDAYDHAVEVLDMVETFRDMATGLVDLYLSNASLRMNEVMKVLTIIATIFIPLTFIVGLYGMNFDIQAGPLNMPELHWAYGYPLVLAVMTLIAAAMLLFFKRRGWL